MQDLQEQLAALRRQIARIDRKYAEPAPPPAPAPKPGRFIEELLTGQVVRTAHGEHFEAEKLWERHRRHGSVDIADLAELPEDLLSSLSDGAIPRAHPTRWAFLDTETTGLAGGTGTYAFLIGVGSIEPEGFRLRQFFMRDYGEEASLLARLSEHLAQFDVLITYNGKAYDQPLLETRFRMSRARHPFERLEHLDLLFGARRLWKLRLESCRLMDLEYQILGVERQGDLPGEMIPYYYFDYLRTRQAFRLAPLFHHNTMDILSLAALTAVVLPAFAAPDGSALRHGEDLLGLARWLRQNGRLPEAVALYRRAIERGLSDPNLFSALWEMAILEKKSGHRDQAVAIWCDLACTKNALRGAALEELAKHYEHMERNYSLALEMTAAALAVAPAPALERRQRRLERKVAEQSRPLLR